MRGGGLRLLGGRRVGCVLRGLGLGRGCRVGDRRPLGCGFGAFGFGRIGSTFGRRQRLLVSILTKSIPTWN